jgi:cytochrome P450
MATPASKDETKEAFEQFPAAELLQCPYATYAEGREGGVEKLPGREEYLVFRHDDIAWALQHEEKFSAYIPGMYTTRGLDYGGAVHLGAQDDPEHKSNRHLLSRAFTPGKVRGYEEMVRRHVDNLIEGFADRGTVEFTHEFAYPLPALVISELMGLPTEGPDFDFLQQWNVTFTQAAPEDDSQRDVFSAMQEYIRAQIESRLEQPTDDMLGDFVQRQIERDGVFDPALATTMGVEMIAGGVVTTGQMITNAMLLLLQAPEELAETRANPKRIVHVLEESLRLEAPVQHRQRYTKEEVELSGTRIPAGSLVHLVFGSGSRDESTFESPEEFQVGRRNVKRHFGFGLGDHFCLGAPLARLEGQIALERLFATLDDIRLDEARSDLRNIETRVFRVPRALQLEFERRQ